MDGASDKEYIEKLIAILSAPQWRLTNRPSFYHKLLLIGNNYTMTLFFVSLFLWHLFWVCVWRISSQEFPSSCWSINRGFDVVVDVFPLVQWSPWVMVYVRNINIVKWMTMVVGAHGSHVVDASVCMNESDGDRHKERVSFHSFV